MSVKRYEPGPTLSKAVEFHHLIALAGMTADNTAGGIKEQTQQVLAKIDKQLAEAGVSKANLLSATIYLADISLKPQMNEVWNAWIDPDNPPARACVGTQLEGNAKVEIAVTAADTAAGGGHGHGHAHSHGDAHGHGHAH